MEKIWDFHLIIHVNNVAHRGITLYNQYFKETLGIAWR